MIDVGLEAQLSPTESDQYCMPLGLSLSLGAVMIGSSGTAAPARLASKVAWYRADDADASSWSDRYGLQAPFLQTTPASRPAVAPAVALLNDRPALQFNGATPTFMTSASSSGWGLLAGYEFWVVMMMTTVNSFNPPITKSEVSGSAWDHYITNSQTIRTINNGSGQTSSASALLVANSPIVMNIKHDGVNTVSWTVNGNAIGSGALGLPLANGVDVHIGKRSDNATLFTGYLAEIVVTSAITTGPSLTSLKTYFSDRYALTVA